MAVELHGQGMDPACYYRFTNLLRGPRITRAEVDRPEINGETDFGETDFDRRGSLTRHVKKPHLQTLSAPFQCPASAHDSEPTGVERPHRECTRQDAHAISHL